MVLEIQLTEVAHLKYQLYVFYGGCCGKVGATLKTWRFCEDLKCRKCFEIAEEEELQYVLIRDRILMVFGFECFCFGIFLC